MWIQDSSGLENFETVGTWRHHQVRKDDVELLSGIEELESFGAAPGRGQAESAGLHVFAKCQSEVTVVFNDEQSGSTRKEIRYLDHEGLFGKSVENFSVPSIMSNFLKAGGCIGFESGTNSGC